MATCKDCLHTEVCEEYGEVFSLIKGGKCSLFKDRSRFVELPDYKYSAKILQATSESLAHFACGLSKLEETKQILKERENNAN